MPFIDTTDLRVAYELHPSSNEEAPAVLLLHGWPDDASTWDDIHPALTEAGFRVVVPNLRGFGKTRFRPEAAPSTGNSGILALDAAELMAVLGIDRYAVIGHDWGANVAEALAVGWPERIERIAMLSTPPRLGGMATPPFWHAQLEWYHWFMATARGARAVEADRCSFTRLHWQNWSPPGWFDEALFERVARSFDNPDWLAVTLHSYRARWDEAEPDPRSAELEARIKATRTLALPALYVQGESDGVNPPPVSEKVSQKFTGPFNRVSLPGTGHFPQRERPAELAGHLVAFLREPRS